MPLDNAQFISELSITDPSGTDALSEGDDQIRTIKRATQQSFPNVDAAVTLSAAELNDVALKSAANVFTVPQIMPGIDADTNFTLRVAGGVAAEIALVARANGAVELYNNNIQRLSTAASGIVELLSDGNTDTELRRLDFSHQDKTQRGFVGHNGSAVFVLQNLINGGNVQLLANDTGAVARTLLDGDPDGATKITAVTDVNITVNADSQSSLSCIANGAVNLFHNNILRLATGASGVVFIRSDLNTDTDQRRLDFVHQNGVLRALLGHPSNDVLQLRNLIEGGNLTFLAESTGGGANTVIDVNPDGDIVLTAKVNTLIQIAGGANAIIGFANAQLQLFHNGVRTAETAPVASGGLLVDNQATGAGLERVLTVSDLSAAAVSVFGGNVDSTGSANALPPGWSSVRTGLGLYTVTHNLGLSAAVDLAVTATIQNTFQTGPHILISPIGVDSFGIRVRNNDIAFDSDFMFTAVDVSTIP